MAVKAKAEITLYHNVDITAIYWFYLLQSSTLATPAKPTTYPPSMSWKLSEPSYTSGSTNSLYVVECTKLSDGTYVYSEVSKSSSYEAAKEAWNKANNAQNSATNANDKIDGLQVGGRNLLWNSDFSKDFSTLTTSRNDFGMWIRGTVYTVTRDVDVIRNSKPTMKIVGSDTGTASGVDILWDIAGVLGATEVKQGSVTGRDLIFSFFAKSTNSSTLSARLGYGNYSNKSVLLTTDWKQYSIQIATNATSSENNQLIMYLNKADTIWLSECKIEYGNKPTDWSPAPEDIDESINDVDDKRKEDRDALDNLGADFKLLDNLIRTISIGKEQSSAVLQSESGLVLNIGAADEIIAVQNSIKELEESMDGFVSVYDKVKAIESASNKLSYIVEGEIEDEDNPNNKIPCIFLGEVDSDFKLAITNKSIQFLIGSKLVAWISKDSFRTDKIIVQDTLQIGEDSKFVWQTRQVGDYKNLGLVYISS